MFKIKQYRENEKLDEDNFYSFESNLVAHLGKFSHAGKEIIENARVDKALL